MPGYITSFGPTVGVISCWDSEKESMCTSDECVFEIAWSSDSWWFIVQSFMSCGFPWAVRILEHNEVLSRLDISSSWIELEAIFEIPETLEVCMDCAIETRSESLVVLGDIVCGCMM